MNKDLKKDRAGSGMEFCPWGNVASIRWFAAFGLGVPGGAKAEDN